MPQSLSRVVVHITFSTADRKPFLIKKEDQQSLHKYVATTLNTLECPAIIVGGVEDHIHILCNLSRKIAVMTLLEEVKTSSSKEMKKGLGITDFYWQGGYGIFSVSESNVPQVRGYIGNQEEHHKKMTFQDEYRILCQKHGVKIDERYVWE